MYAFVDAHGQPLYVGKSVNLRRRVRSYFYGGGPDSERLAEMLRIARGVMATSTGSDLEARLEEAERILDERPPYNKALKRRAAGWYLELRWNEPYPRLRIVRRPRRAGARYYGPFWGRRMPEMVVRLTEKIFRLRSCAEPIRPDPGRTPCIQFDLGLCTAPCARHVRLDAYRRQVEAAARFLEDVSYGWTLRDRIEEARDRASADLRFEAAAAHQARLDWLDELDRFRWALDEDAAMRSWLIVLPGVKDGTIVLQPVARGRVLLRRTAERRDERWRSMVEDACYAVRVAELRAPSVLSPRDQVPGLMVTRWLEEGGDDGIAIDLEDTDADGAIERLAASPWPGEAASDVSRADPMSSTDPQPAGDQSAAVAF